MGGCGPTRLTDASRQLSSPSGQGGMPLEAHGERADKRLSVKRKRKKREMSGQGKGGGRCDLACWMAGLQSGERPAVRETRVAIC